MSPQGYEAEEPPSISTKCSSGLPAATQNQERERGNDSTLGLVPKLANQCGAISSKVGLVTFILPCLSIQRSILSNLSNLEPPWEDYSYLIGGVRVPPWEDYSYLIGGLLLSIRSPFETQNCDLSQTRIDHETENVQQTQHHQTQGAYHLFHD
jgi:hypothetical protein